MKEHSNANARQDLLVGLMQYSNDVILCLSDEAKLLDLNPIAEQIYGWSREKALNKNYFDLCSSNETTSIAKNAAELLTYKSGYKFCQDVQASDKSKYSIAWSINHINSGDGSSIVLLIGKNVSRERQLKRQCDTTEIYLDNIISQIPEYVFWKDKDSVYLGCNDLLAKATGLKSRDDIIGKTDEDFGWDPARVAWLRKIDEEVMEKGIPRTFEEQIALPLNSLHCITYKVPLKDKQNNIIGILGISVDITERKLAEEALKEAKEKAEIANEAKTQFIQNMEHDLRTPSSGVAQMVHLLEERETDPEKKEMLIYVSKAAKQLLELINGILKFNKTSIANHRGSVNKFNVKMLVCDILVANHF